MIITLLLFAAQASQPALLPLSETDRYQEPTRLVLQTLDWDSRWGIPQPSGGMGYAPEQAAAIGYFYVQAKEGSWASLRDLVWAQGGQVFDYLPHNGFEAWLPVSAMGAVSTQAQMLVPVHPDWKVSPDVGMNGTAANSFDGRMEISVEFWPDRDLTSEEDAIRALDIQVVESFDSGRYIRADVRADFFEVAALAFLPGIKWIQEAPIAEQRNDKSAWVIQSFVSNNTPIWDQGVDGSNVTVGHIDGKIQESSCYFNDPSGAAVGPGHRKIKWWSGGGGADSHGTHTAGSAVGDQEPVTGNTLRNGMAPKAFVVHRSGFPGGSGLLSWLNTAHTNGGRLHTNSWGNDNTRNYDAWCRDIDAYSHDNEDGAVFFAETNGSTLKNPENAKNVVAVAATSRNNPENHGSGGVGPTKDGRRKPELFAPGCSTYSASTSSCGTTTMCGTSMACPVVTGAAALLKQYFESGYYPTGSPIAANGFTPSGALLRACLVNSAMDMTGISGYLGNKEGYGRINLDDVAYFSGDSRRTFVADVPHANGMSTGDTKVFKFRLWTNSPEMRLTLAFTDEPGAANTNDPVVNDLNLSLMAPDGTIYRGGILSTTDGSATPNPGTQDAKNSIEQILLKNPATGTYWIQVEALSVPSGPQGFAGVLSI